MDLAGKHWKRGHLPRRLSTQDYWGYSGGPRQSITDFDAASTSTERALAVTEPNTLNALDVRDWYSVLMGRRILESLSTSTC